jgi:acyl carrier protein
MQMSETKTVENEIKEIIAGILEVEPEKIAPEAKFVEDLGMDSMMALEIVASIEKKYKITIPEEALMKLASLNDVINITKQYLNKA